MRNLFQLLWKNNFTLLFILLQLIALSLVVRNNRFQQTSVFNSTNIVAGSIMSAVSYMTEYVYLKENNRILAIENAKLKSSVSESYYNYESFKQTVSDSTLKQEYSYIPARIINNSVNRRNNYLTLNKGADHGIKPEMGVISSNGVVGIVQHVSDHFCTVMSILHKNSSISARFSHNNYFGSLKWDGKDPEYGRLHEIPNHVQFEVGDTLVTTRYSSIFPENVLVGTVTDSQSDEGGNFQILTVKLSTGFSNLSYVYIVDYLLKGEQQELEALTIEQDDN